MNLKCKITHNKFQTIIDGYLMSVEQYFSNINYRNKFTINR
jgi:hypothetical protein